MRFHVIGLPHTQTTSEYLTCAYTQKVIKFCNMMFDLGHEVYLYAGIENEARCTEFIPVIDTKIPASDYLKQKFEPDDIKWRAMNEAAIFSIGKRIEDKDFICAIAGVCQEQIAKAYPNHMTVEYGIGYEGTFAKYKVYESYAWMHAMYGKTGPSATNGDFFDAVIPNYFDPKDFPLKVTRKKSDYFLYIGRLIDRKGWRIAQEVCEKMDVPLIVAGPGEFSGYGKYVGVVDSRQRAELMSKAKAVFVPTLYIEPFGGVMVEANLCGAPVITTDWGAFTENVEDGVNGFRCRTFREFCEATKQVKLLNSEKIQVEALKKYSMNKVAFDYEEYFEKLMTLWDKGWYA